MSMRRSRRSRENDEAHARAEAGPLAGASPLWAALLLLGAWLRWPTPWLLAAIPVVLVPIYRRGLRPTFSEAMAVLVLLAATAGGFAAHHQLHRIQTVWSQVWDDRRTRAEAILGRDLDQLLQSGDGAVSALSVAAEESGAPPGPAELRALRRRQGMAAVAVYDRSGELVTWDGVHRGAVPETVRQGATPYEYGERPLFSYLYFTEPIPSTGGTAVAAALLRISLPPGLGSNGSDFLSGVEERTGENLRISRAERMRGEVGWDLNWEGEILFSVGIVEPRQTEEREAVLLRWGRILGLLAAATWPLLALTGGPSRIRIPMAGATLLLFAAGLPLRRLTGLEGIGSPTSFLLAAPLEATLLRTVAVGAAALVTVGMAVSWWRLGRAVPGLLIVSLGFSAVVWMFGTAPSAEFIVESDRAFLTVQVGLALLLTLVAGAGLFVGAAEEDAEGGAGLLGVALAGCVLLAALTAVAVAVRGDLSPVVAALWAGPAALAMRASGRGRGWAGGLPLWLVAGFLGATCALTFAWESRVASRMEVGETHLARLGDPADPYTEFLLRRFAESVDSMDAVGAGPVELLYGAWVDSGLAEEGIAAWLTLWSAGDLPVEDLRIGVPPPRPPAADEFLDEARVNDQGVIRPLQRADAHYVAAVPLASGATVTAVIPPRTVTAGLVSLEPLFGAAEPPNGRPLTIVPLLPGDRATAPDSTIWHRVDWEWRGERTFELPQGPHHAHYRVPLPGPALLTARGTLLLVLDLGVIGLLLGFGLLVPSGRPIPLGRILGVARTFQGRVTIALFGFFLVAVTLFGILGYRVLSGAAVRTASALAERVGAEAAGWYVEVQGSMDLLARRVGADLLEYQDGQLVGGSVTELVELGLYEGWLPFDVHRSLASGEDLLGQEVNAVGSWEYVVAYRRLPNGDVLGAPVSLQAGAAAVRRQEMGEFLGFAVLVGGALSLGLAFLVGRTLARPLQELRGVAGRVGRGDLRVQLPRGRPDEFGAVYRDFNRMVARLRRARRDLVRTTRRTEAIVEEAATGVVALDSARRVTLVNPRAEELLHVRLLAGEMLPRGDGPAGELARWVEEYVRRGIPAAGTELQAGERRIRVQARRISGRRRMGGSVLSLEDVTDELRTERILAWGEMAQQVAHEVKNPLTPIKLSVQHIRRAWEDQRGDFGRILERNVQAILTEIDRLAAIASSFSRFAAPGSASEGPLVPVHLQVVVAEILDLYATDEASVRFEASVPAELPPVRGRPDEIKEVLVNLLENARTAIADEGVVRVEAEALDEGVELRVRDDGQGIPDHLIPRIFEPHFSTRSAGTGLGLAIVRRLVETWGGAVSVRSEVGVGTTVRVLFATWPEGSGEGASVLTV